MKTVPVSELLTLIDDDVEIASDRLSLNSNGYILVDGRTLLHRLVIGAEKGEVIDHINGNRLDNRRENLRRTTHQAGAWARWFNQRGGRRKDFKTSQRKRKLHEEIFGWLKQFGGLRRMRVTGRWKIQQYADIALSALNLIRMSRLLAT